MPDDASPSGVRPETYQALVVAVQHAEDVSWNRFNNYLFVNSIIILAWATVWSNIDLSPDRAGLLVLMAALGLFSGVVWSGLGYRGRTFLLKYNEAGLVLDAKLRRLSGSGGDSGYFTICDEQRRGLPFSTCSSFPTVVHGPLLINWFYVYLSGILGLAKPLFIPTWFLLVGSVVAQFLFIRYVLRKSSETDKRKTGKPLWKTMRWMQIGAGSCVGLLLYTVVTQLW